MSPPFEGHLLLMAELEQVGESVRASSAPFSKSREVETELEDYHHNGHNELDGIPTASSPSDLVEETPADYDWKAPDEQREVSRLERPPPEHESVIIVGKEARNEWQRLLYGAEALCTRHGSSPASNWFGEDI